MYLFLENLFSTSTVVGDKLHNYDVHEALYINCEIHGPWVWGSGLGCDHYDHILKTY